VRGCGDAIEDGLGRGGRREQAEEEEPDHVRDALLDRGRNVGRRAQTLRRVHRQDAYLAGAIELEHLRGHVRGHHRNVPADEIGDAGARALVRDVNEIVEAGELLEQLARQVAHGAGTGGAVGQLAGIGLGIGNELLERSHRDGFVHHDGGGGDGDDGNGHEVAGGIVRHLGHGHRVEHHGAGAAEQDGVAVGLRARDLAGGDGAAAAALVLDIDGAEQRLHSLGPLPRDDVVHPAGRERHHQLDRPLRIVALRRGEARRPRARERRRSEGQKFTPVHRRPRS
jgi:hypothetical protein